MTKICRRAYTPHSCLFPYACVCVCSSTAYAYASLWSRSTSALPYGSPRSHLFPLCVCVLVSDLVPVSFSLSASAFGSRSRLLEFLVCACGPTPRSFVFPLLPLLSTLVLLGARNLRMGVADARSSPPFACSLACSCSRSNYLPTYLPAPRPPPSSSLSARADLCRVAHHLISSLSLPTTSVPLHRPSASAPHVFVKPRYPLPAQPFLILSLPRSATGYRTFLPALACLQVPCLVRVGAGARAPVGISSERGWLVG